jgi:hypothetical protein
VLYVFDTKPWNQVSSVAEGEYIDLVSIVPEGVNRPRRQAGGVLYALGWSPGNGDLSGLVRAKFEVRFPWEEVGQHWETDYLFPGPAEDPIYSSLLQAPFFRTVEKRADGSEGVVYRRSCTLPEYCRGPEDAQRQASYRSYDHRLKPTLYYPWLRQNLEQLQANPNWLPNFRPAFEQSIPIMLQRPHILFSMHRRGPAPPPEAPPSTVPHPFQNFFLEYSPEDLAIAYDENRKARGFWCFFFPDEFLLQSFGTAKGEPYAEDYHIYQWQPGRGLVQTEGPDKMGSYVTEPLDLIRMTVEGLLRLDPPGNLGHGYYELTTTEQFWSALPTWTDLM